MTGRKIEQNINDHFGSLTQTEAHLWAFFCRFVSTLGVWKAKPKKNIL